MATGSAYVLSGFLFDCADMPRQAITTTCNSRTESAGLRHLNFDLVQIGHCGSCHGLRQRRPGFRRFKVSILKFLAKEPLGDALSWTKAFRWDRCELSGAMTTGASPGK